MKKITTRKITLTAMLIVIDILLTSLPRYFEVGSFFSFNRITLGPATTIFSSLVLGPFYGAMVGGISDLLSWIIFPNSGLPINIFITFLYILLGIIPYFLHKLFEKKNVANKVSLPIFLGVILISFLSILNLTNFFDETFVIWRFNLVLTKILISSFSSLFFILMYVVLRKIRKNNEENFDNIGLICIICELLLMVVLKPLCFSGYAYLFFNKSLREFFGVTYSFLVMMGFMFSTVMIPLNTFFVGYVRKIFLKNFKF